MNAALVNSIICPNCNIELSSQARFCSRCGTATCSLGESPEAARPPRMPVASHVAAPSKSPALINRPWFIVVMLLHVGFLGIPLFWKTGYSVRTRLMICLLSIAYTFFAVSVIGGVGWYLYQQFVSL